MKQYGFSSELRASGDTGMVLEGRAIVFNVPTVLYEMGGIKYQEIISNRALDNTDLTDVVLRYNHSGEYTILARTRNKSLQLEKRLDGLYMKANLQPDISQHQDVYNAVKSGLVDKMSFAFVTAEGGDSYDQTGHVRTINAVRKLFDLSVVDIPAYDATFVEARSQIEQYINIEEIRSATLIRLNLLRGRLKNE